MTPYLLDWVHDVLNETPHQALLCLLDKLFGFLVVELVSPQPPHHLLFINLELVSVHLGKLLQVESPAVQARTKPDGTLGWINLWKKHVKIGINAWCTGLIRKRLGCHRVLTVQVIQEV